MAFQQAIGDRHVATLYATEQNSAVFQTSLGRFSVNPNRVCTDHATLTTIIQKPTATMSEVTSSHLGCAHGNQNRDFVETKNGSKFENSNMKVASLQACSCHGSKHSNRAGIGRVAADTRHVGTVYDTFAEQNFEVTKDADAEFTKSTINCIMRACRRSGDLERAERCIDFMEASGIGVDLENYNSVINLCASKSDLHRSALWFDRMPSFGLTPNEITFGALCKVLARHGEAAKIETLMCALEKSDINVNEYFYASLIAACMHSRPVDVERAERALSAMVSRGLSTKRMRGPIARTLGQLQADNLIKRAGGSTAEQQMSPVSYRRGSGVGGRSANELRENKCQENALSTRR
eukprot:TRINITY_DN48630_c0_g1_i1.p1 TRINITY_DN48630_c0_g1~~TRINITY_DN48630_c0_g1_i1.p1  ORF type:complete len:351 (-),score=43.92 TRINITY_DN48630_c0_g1_i1:95-1147(-)